jgi:hypothetical protein
MQTSSPAAASIEALGAAVDVLANEDINLLHSSALGEDLVALRGCIERLEAEFCRRLQRFDRAHGPAAEGLSAITWLRHNCNLAVSDAAQRVGVAEHLGAVTGAEEAFRDGRFGLRSAATLARCAEKVGAEVVAGDVGRDLLDAALRLHPDPLRHVALHLRHCADPDGALADANDDHARRWLSVSSSIDGIVFVDGRLDAEGGAVLRTALNALDSPGDGRSPKERRADALVEMAWRQLQVSDHRHAGGQRPHLTLTSCDATLQRQPGSPGAALEWAGVIPAETARRLACDAALTPIAVDSGGAPLNVGRTRRTVPASLRRALVARDHGCRFPGCDLPPEWTDGHHITHWADGGETRLDNLVLLCRRHHRRVHEHRWRLEGNPSGELVAVPP